MTPLWSRISEWCYSAQIGTHEWRVWLSSAGTSWHAGFEGDCADGTRFAFPDAKAAMAWVESVEKTGRKRAKRGGR